MFEQLKLLVRQHTSEIAILGVMTGVMLAIGLIATGDIGEAIAGRRR